MADTPSQFRSNWLVDPATGDYSASIPSPTGISADPALTAHGVDQARELGAHLMTLTPPVGAVFSSPYYRCLQTIAPFTDLHAAAAGDESPAARIRPEAGIAEWYGSAPFEHPQPADGAALKRLFPRYDEGYVSGAAPRADGETVEELYERVARGVAGIIDKCDAEGVRAAVLCTHAATMIALGRVLTGRVPADVGEADFEAFTCGLSVFRRRRGGGEEKDAPAEWRGKGVRGGWTCEVNGDCSFLSKGEERGW